jgi:tRNA uridine 5-carbamoylmethylation protein Kti12
MWVNWWNEESEASDIKDARSAVDSLRPNYRRDSTMDNWKSFSRKVVLEANSRLSQRKQGISFALPKELAGIVEFRQKSTEDIEQAFRAASRKLRRG